LKGEGAKSGELKSSSSILPPTLRGRAGEMIVIQDLPSQEGSDWDTQSKAHTRQLSSELLFGQ